MPRLDREIRNLFVSTVLMCSLAAAAVYFFSDGSAGPGSAGFTALMIFTTHYYFYNTPYCCHEAFHYSGACLPLSSKELNAPFSRRLASICLSSFHGQVS